MVRESGGSGHRNVLRRGFEPAREAAKLPSSLTLHDLRHAAASRLINAHLDPVTGFNAGATLFRSGWFVELLATQSLAIFAIRTRRIPFYGSRPSAALLSTFVVVAIGIALPFSPLAPVLGMTRLPAGLVVVVAAILPSYLLLLDLAKRGFYRLEASRPTLERSRPSRARRIARRAARWSVPTLVRHTPRSLFANAFTLKPGPRST